MEVFETEINEDPLLCVLSPDMYFVNKQAFSNERSRIAEDPAGETETVQKNKARAAASAKLRESQAEGRSRRAPKASARKVNATATTASSGPSPFFPQFPPTQQPAAEQIDSSKGPPTSEEKLLLDELLGLATKAKSGDTKAARELSAKLDARPEVWQHLGDLGRHAQSALILRVSAANPLVVESMQRSADALRAELLGDSSDPLVRLSVQGVVAAWMFQQFVEIAFFSFENQPPRGLANVIEVAARRYHQALRSLNLAKLMEARGHYRPSPTPATAVHTGDDINGEIS